MEVKDFENRRWSEKFQKMEFRHRVAPGLISGNTVLDVGCGDGLLMKELARAGKQVEGIDLSGVAVERCRKEGLKATEGDFASGPLPFAEKQFETVVALDVLEHVYEPERLLKEMVRVSSDAVVISVPNFSSLPARLQVLFGKVPENNRPNKGHVYWFNWPVLQSHLKNNGLYISAMEVNAPWERIPVVGLLTGWCARLLPNLCALSFVIQCKKI